jgi:DnaJ-class molecular chaperone
VCEGVDEMEEMAMVEVTVRPGCREGTRVPIRGTGDRPAPGMPVGDSVVPVHVVDL